MYQTPTLYFVTFSAHNPPPDKRQRKRKRKRKRETERQRDRERERERDGEREREMERERERQRETEREREIKLPSLTLAVYYQPVCMHEPGAFQSVAMQFGSPLVTIIGVTTFNVVCKIKPAVFPG